MQEQSPDYRPSCVGCDKIPEPLLPENHRVWEIFCATGYGLLKDDGGISLVDARAALLAFGVEPEEMAFEFKKLILCAQILALKDD